MTEERQQMLLELKKLINNGDFNFSGGDDWYEEDWQYFSINDNDDLELVEVEYRWEYSWRGIYEVWGRGESGEGRETLGNILDFVLNRKFGNTAVEDKWQEVISYLRNTDNYGIQDAIPTETNEWDGEDYDDFDYETEYEEYSDDEEQELDNVKAEEEIAAIIRDIEDALC